MKRISIFSIALSMLLLLVACAPVGAPAEPAATAEETATETPVAEEPAMMDIVDTAIAAGNFNTLVAAVEAAGLVDALKGEGPFTVFAPTDDAFAAIPKETIDALLADPSGDLTQILLYHVIEGKVMAADVTDGLEATTLQGAPVTFTIADGAVKINDATIVATDIETSNGVIHVIDAVIMPPTQ
jgi:transforming growth factor-beta-induced protein